MEQRSFHPTPELNPEGKSLRMRGPKLALPWLAFLSASGIALCLYCVAPKTVEARARPQTQPLKLGVTRFVAPTGNDGGPGTADRPWATINHAADEAKAGDTVVVRGGDYVCPNKCDCAIRDALSPRSPSAATWRTAHLGRTADTTLGTGA